MILKLSKETPPQLIVRIEKLCQKYSLQEFSNVLSECNPTWKQETKFTQIYKQTIQNQFIYSCYQYIIQWNVDRFMKPFALKKVPKLLLNLTNIKFTNLLNLSLIGSNINNIESLAWINSLQNLMFLNLQDNPFTSLKTFRKIKLKNLKNIYFSHFTLSAPAFKHFQRTQISANIDYFSTFLLGFEIITQKQIISQIISPVVVMLCSQLVKIKTRNIGKIYVWSFTEQGVYTGQIVSHFKQKRITHRHLVQIL